MCYNTRQSRKAKDLERYYERDRLLGEMPEDQELIYNSANGFAHPNMWIIPQERPNNFIPVKWGLIPKGNLGANADEYYKNSIRYGSGLNARSEKLFYSNQYAPSAFTRRCIIPVDGFFEPHTAKKNGKDFKIPFYFCRKNEAPISLAGIYAVTTDKLVTFTILTKEATPLFAKIHNKKNRRPVILNDEDIDTWLSNDLDQDEVNEVIYEDLPDEELNAYPISKDLYKRNGEADREDIIEKVEYEELEIDY
ncbi:SOS response-associated peptidase [Maribacter sp. 2307UL18-2]|uniref:SOS response-associated peptidase n=1 Tax=Maribacter sp. 2307UL18-2 TaxID=3386274 RepID=UPI0039BCF29E